MKVSILTYHWEDNYGATMQAYATYKAIAELGHVPEFIDLRLPDNRSLKSKIVFFLKHKRFNNFRKRYFKNLSQRIYRSVVELKRNPPESDCYLVGSDQTWNPQIAKELLPAFFLTFGKDSIKRITYATSIGLNEWEESPFISNEEIKQSLKRFDKILLREDSGIKIAHDVFKVNALQVVDPVLLFSNYSELTGPIESSGEIITYKLINDEGFYESAYNFSKKRRLPIRSVGSIRTPKGFRTTYPETLQNWIKRFAGAEYVITDSFHGTVFSLLYHRPFVVCVGNPLRVTRIVSLLSQLGLENRIVSKGNGKTSIEDVLKTPIDWEIIENKINSLRKQSMNALKEALELPKI